MRLSQRSAWPFSNVYWGWCGSWVGVGPGDLSFVVFRLLEEAVPFTPGKGSQGPGITECIQDAWWTQPRAASL